MKKVSEATKKMIENINSLSADEFRKSVKMVNGIYIQDIKQPLSLDELETLNNTFISITGTPKYFFYKYIWDYKEADKQEIHKIILNKYKDSFEVIETIADIF